MKWPLTLNRYFALTLLLALGLTLAAAVISWTTAIEQRNAMLRESRFQFSLNSARSALESGLRLGLLLSDLPGAKELIDQNRMQERVILSIDVFDDKGQIVFTTDSTGVSANIPLAWLDNCLNKQRRNWSGQDDEGRLLCGPLVNGYEELVGGVLLRYRLNNRASIVGMLERYPLAGLGMLLILAACGGMAGWLVLRPIENHLNQQASAIAGLGPPGDNDLSGPLACALATLEQIENRIGAIDREADRLDNLG